MMKQFLKKIKLTDHLTTEIEIQKNEFVARFREQVDEGDTSIFSNMFEAFSSGKNEYKGNIGINDFRIKRRRRLFDTNINLPEARGTLTQQENILIIDTEINGLTGMMIPFYLFAILFYSIFIYLFMFTDNIEENGVEITFPFLFIHAGIMFGIPYFIMRRSVKRMKYELEREFYYLTKPKSLPDKE